MYPTKDIPTLRCLYEFIVEKLPAGAKVPAHNTFFDWYRFSCRFANLAEGGTVYLLLIVAGLDLRWSVAKAQGRVIWEVAKLLRAPDNTGEHLLAARIRSALS